MSMVVVSWALRSYRCVQASNHVSSAQFLDKGKAPFQLTRTQWGAGTFLIPISLLLLILDIFHNKEQKHTPPSCQTLSYGSEQTLSRSLTW